MMHLGEEGEGNGPAGSREGARHLEFLVLI